MKEGSKLRKFFDKLWFILWKDESFKGWLLSILIIFVFIKFIFFPTLSFVTGTTLPLAIVESCSMYHSGNLLSNYNSWWQTHSWKYEDFNLTKEIFDDFIFTKGFNKGDILFIVGVKPEKVKVGDVIIFNADKVHPIIHRVMGIENTSEGLVFQTMGDNNNGQLVVEKSIHSNQIVGKAVFKLAPYAGWVKLIFYESRRTSSERGFCSEN
jgi:signal peptidase I